jgi:DNA-binding NarL/FixJ family response regulator
MSSPAPIRILLVDDHFLVRMGLAAVLALEKDFVIAGEAEDAESTLTQFRQLKPDITLLDVRMPGVSGVETLKNIREVNPDAKVIMLTTSDLEEDIFQALESGANGYLLKTAQRAELAEAIRHVHRGGQAVPPNIEAKLAERAHRRALSPRELEVLDFLRRGLSNRDIGVALGVTEHTAKAHVKAILSKLESADRAEAVANGFRLGLLKLEE